MSRGCNSALHGSGLKACFLCTLSVPSWPAKLCAAADESLLTMCWLNGLLFSLYGLPKGFNDDDLLDSMLDNTVYGMMEQPAQHATAIPSRKYPFSSDQGSQTGLGSILSTRLSDRPGTLSAVVFMNKPRNGAIQLVLLPILFLPSYLLPFYLPSYLLPCPLCMACNRALMLSGEIWMKACCPQIFISLSHAGTAL